MEGRTILGFNYRMNELQGALGLAQLRKLDWLIGEQKKNKQAIKDWLVAVPGINFLEIPDPEGDTATFLAFNLPDQSTAAAFQKALAENGVDTTCFKNNLWHYVPNWEHFQAWSTANSQRFPFSNPLYRGKIDYGRHLIPQAEDILGRTLAMGLCVKMSEERMAGIKAAIEKAAETI